MGLRILTALLLCQAAARPGQAQPGFTVAISILDQANRPVPGVRMELKSAQANVASAETDQYGRAEFTQLKPALYQIVATKVGLESITRDVDLSKGESASVEFTAIPTIEHREKIEVQGTVAPVEQ